MLSRCRFPRPYGEVLSVLCCCWDSHLSPSCHRVHLLLPETPLWGILAYMSPPAVRLCMAAATGLARYIGYSQLSDSSRRFAQPGLLSVWGLATHQSLSARGSHTRAYRYQAGGGGGIAGALPPTSLHFYFARDCIKAFDFSDQKI